MKKFPSRDVPICSKKQPLRVSLRMVIGDDKSSSDQIAIEAYRGRAPVCIVDGFLF